MPWQVHVLDHCKKTIVESAVPLRRAKLVEIRVCIGTAYMRMRQVPKFKQ